MGLKYHCDICDDVVTEAANHIEVEFSCQGFSPIIARGMIDVTRNCKPIWICHKCTEERLCLPEQMKLPLVSLFKTLKG